jgi:hypothetical protein
MTYAEKIVLHCKSGTTTRLEELIEKFIEDGVKLVAVAGIDCAKVEDIIDEIVVGDGKDEHRFILTSAHPDESLEEVISFAMSIHEGGKVAPQVIEI